MATPGTTGSSKTGGGEKQHIIDCYIPYCYGMLHNAMDAMEFYRMLWNATYHRLQ
jgi:hypothetical protein